MTNIKHYAYTKQIFYALFYAQSKYISYMTESERLKCVIEYYKMNTNKFAEYIGLKSAQNLYDVLKGRNGISKDLSEKIKALCVNVNISWLLTGEGDMLKSASQGNEETGEKHKEKNQNIIAIPQDIWDVIKNQAECLKIKDKESKKQGERIDRLITLLEKKFSDSPNGDNKNKEAI